LGKYQTKFYKENGKGYHSSILGGLLTLALFLFLAVNIVMIIKELLTDPIYKTSQQVYDFKKEQLKLEVFSENLFKPRISIFRVFEDAQKCSEIQLKITYRLSDQHSDKNFSVPFDNLIKD
jgi:hypothetical protein